MHINRLIIFLFIIGFVSFEVIAQKKNVPREIAPLQAPFVMEELRRPSFPDRTFDIRNFGAVQTSDKENLKSTKAIQQAIEAAKHSGGGKVLIPEGEWLTGPIHLMSNVNLHIVEGATVYFSENKEDYLPVVRHRYEGVEAYNYSSMIYAREVSNVAITGKGTLDANGDHWWEWRDVPPRAIATKQPLSQRKFGKGAGIEGMRPNFVVFWESENILVEGITLLDSPMWNIHLIYSNRAIVRDITINSLRSPNGDGVVLDSSKNILVEYNHFETGDDAVVLKSGFNEEGLQINIPTENIVVRNFEARNVRTGSGGIVFGSETSGGIKNVYVHNAYFEGSDRGIRFKTERGRGNVIENIFIRDIRMKDINNQAINFNTFYTGSGAIGPAPLIRNVSIRDIQIDGVPEAINLIGLPEKWLENIVLENIQVENTNVGARITRVKNLTLKNVQINSDERAMIATDVYEMVFKNVTLKDDSDGLPLLFEGRYTDAIFMEDYPMNQIQFNDGLSAEIIKEEPMQKVW